jgi:glyoxylase I family protein
MLTPDILRIHHVAILTSNELYEKSKQFYVDILGFKVIRETFREARNSYKLDLSIQGNYQIELFSFPDFRERGSYPECKGLRHLSFAVKNLDHTVQVLQDRGVITEAIRIDELTGKRFTFFEDPNQQPLEIYEE